MTHEVWYICTDDIWAHSSAHTLWQCQTIWPEDPNQLHYDDCIVYYTSIPIHCCHNRYSTYTTCRSMLYKWTSHSNMCSRSDLHLMIAYLSALLLLLIYLCPQWTEGNKLNDLNGQFKATMIPKMIIFMILPCKGVNVSQGKIERIKYVKQLQNIPITYASNSRTRRYISAVKAPTFVFPEFLCVY